MGSTRLCDPKPVPSLPALGHCMLQAGHFSMYCQALPPLSQAVWLGDLPWVPVGWKRSQDVSASAVIL